MKLTLLTVGYHCPTTLQMQVGSESRIITTRQLDIENTVKFWRGELGILASTFTIDVDNASVAKWLQARPFLPPMKTSEELFNDLGVNFNYRCIT